MGNVAGGVLGAGFGLYNAISGAREARDARRAAEAYQRQELTNVGDGLQVSTMGSDLQREENARMSATAVDALAGGGARALIGGIGSVQRNNNLVNQEIGANLDMQQKGIDQFKAQDQARIRQMQEDRENADLAALSSQMQAGKNQQQMGFGNLIQSASGLTNAAMGAFGSREPQMREQLSPVGSGLAQGFDFSNPSNAQPESMNYRPRRGGLGNMMQYDSFGNLITL